MKPTILTALTVSALSGSAVIDDIALEAIFPPGSTARPHLADDGFVIEDQSGKRVGWLRPDTTYGGYAILDQDGRRIGSIRYDSAGDEWTIERCRHRAPKSPARDTPSC